MSNLPKLPPLPRKSRAPRRDSGEEVPSGSLTTYSIRLTPDERDRLEDALKVTGWSAAYFLTRAAKERAAHVLNARTPRSFDFDQLARRVATQLCAPEGRAFNHGGEPLDLAQIEEHHGISFIADKFEEAAVRQLAEGIRLAGPEFDAKVIDECQRIVINRSALPEPIDPAKR